MKKPETGEASDQRTPLTQGTIGFLGLGKMGLPMATHLVKAGYRVQGFDLSTEAQKQFEEVGGTIAQSPVAAVTDADVLILMLPNSDAVESVFFDEAFASALPEGMIAIDMGSSEPLRTRSLEAKLVKHGVRLIDAPVS
ncbi:MAG TPA: NAD(P)-binding domain-containing protein, partial [Candidatus Nanopelagicaceae bacterium]